MSQRIVFTGGGTAGHVTPNVALIEVFQREGWGIDYIGSIDGVERGMIAEINIPYHPIRCGKLRRYFSWKNFLDPINLLMGIMQAFFLLRKIKPNVVFSKGGFVALPVVIGAWLNRIPVVAHESDMSPGLANRLSFPFVDTICVTFDEGKKYFKRQDKVIVTGTPIREELMHGNASKGLALCGFNEEKPVLLVIGGSQGARVINQCVRERLDHLCQNFQIIHLCGKGKVDHSLKDKRGYCQFEYANEELADLFAASSTVISRAGANSLYEILALKKPHVLIPLSLQSSRGDQIQNAAYFQQQGISIVINESGLTPVTLFAAIEAVMINHEAIIEKMEALQIKSATVMIVAILKDKARG
jgi:UDP-N-acetylglucosamine--N-acetylmuramyl-(pentapeptide) pyrophosphoryl-undecaprenol N-acetylglucosamine transferase